MLVKHLIRKSLLLDIHDILLALNLPIIYKENRKVINLATFAKNLTEKRGQAKHKETFITDICRLIQQSSKCKHIIGSPKSLCYRLSGRVSLYDMADLPSEQLNLFTDYSSVVEAYLTAHHLTWSELIQIDLTRQALLLVNYSTITSHLSNKNSGLRLKDLYTLTPETFNLMIQHAELYSFVAINFSFTEITGKRFLPRTPEKQILLFKNLSRLKKIYEKSNDSHFSAASGISSIKIHEYAHTYGDPDKWVDGLITLCDCFEKEDDPKKPKTNQLIANTRKEYDWSLYLSYRINSQRQKPSRERDILDYDFERYRFDCLNNTQLTRTSDNDPPKLTGTVEPTQTLDNDQPKSRTVEPTQTLNSDLIHYWSKRRYLRYLLYRAVMWSSILGSLAGSLLLVWNIRIPHTTVLLFKILMLI
jgi:hypothetical protein